MASPSSPALTTVWESGEKAIRATPAAWAPVPATVFSVAMSKKCTVPSASPYASVRPSGLSAAETNAALRRGPGFSEIRRIVSVSQVEIAPSVELTIAQTDPGVQGDRVSGARKPATLQTGLVVQVPLFVNVGDRLKVDTRTSEYIARA